MSIVDQTPATEAVRERQRAAMLAAIDLLGRDLPPAYFTVHNHHDAARLHVGIVSPFTLDNDRAQAALCAWLDALGITEFTQSNSSDRIQLAAKGTHMGVEIVLKAIVYIDPEPVKVNVRTVTV